MNLPPPHTELDYTVAASALAELLRWVTEPIHGARVNSHQYTKAIRNRTLALTWAINPELLGGISMRELSRRMGIAPRNFTHFTREARVRFGLRNVYSVHDWRKH